MGAWGSGIFENDDAADFVIDVVEGCDLTPIEAAIEQVLLIGPDYLEAPEASRALAAGAILARLKNRDSQVADGGPELDRWINEAQLSIPEGLLDKSRRAAQRILTSPSELLELWSESDEFDNWKASISSLTSKL
jgi:hypothetical protein